MGVIKRKAEILGLKNLDVLIEDTAFESTYFQILECPSVLTQGKSSFLIGGSDKLKTGVEVKVEIVNNETNEVLYTEPIRGHLEGNLRRVSIEVYEDVTPGPYTIYIVGELNPSTVNVPQEWLGAYNVRWSKVITVNGLGVNTQPIYFYKQPTLNVSEIFTGFVEVPSSSATPIYLTGSGEPRPGLSSIVPVENSTGGGFGTSTYPELDFANKAKLSIIEENKPLVKLSGKHGLIGAQGQQVQTMSPVPNDFVITVSGDSSVNSLYVGHNITINNPQVDTSKFTTQSYHSIPAVYSSSVMKVLNSTSFVPKDVFYVYDNRTSPATLEPAPLASTYPISASYLTLPTQSTSSINLLSFADIQLSDLRTFSGDVHKLKIYAKSEGSLGDFQLIYDSPVESSQVLYDKTEDTLLSNMGYFLNTSRLQKYWEIYDGNDGGTSGTITYDATYINDAMKVSGSNKEYKDTIRVQNKTAVDFVKGTLYSFRAKVYGIKRDKKDIDGNVTAAASFKVFAKGDAFDTEIPTSAHWGAEKLSIPDFPTGTGEYDFGIVEGNFIADNTGTGYVQFKVDSGEWYLSDIQLKAATDTAFNPETVRVKAPVPSLLQRPDRVRFLVEFYDVNNNIADSVIFSEPFDFQGANINISGTDNILSGSMFIGNAIASGIEMAGVSSAYVRSMGYLGFLSGSGGGNNPGDGTNSGFLMWSGSVLPDSGDDYKGVGLELVGHSGSYFKFRTNPSELDIRTDKFFIGQESIQFMSGSDGNIEVSSSIFHLDPQNNVLIIGADAVINADLSVDSIQTPALIGGAPSTFANASASITAQGNVSFKSGSIAGWKIIGSKLSGSNATLDAEGAALYHSLKGPGSDSPAGGFHQLRDEYYIDFTPSQGATATAGKYYVKFGPNFSVSQSGVLFASGAVFEGTITASAGLIGGWSIEDTYIGSVPDGLRLYGNSSNSPYHISSSDFQVRTTGEITSSAGLIGGWTITDGYISKALSGSAAHQAYTRVYLSATTDNDKNIQEGLHVYRKDEDIEDGEVKIVRVGGLSDTTNLHANNDYGLQVIQKNSSSNYSNVMYIGESTQTISGFSINPVAIHSSDKSLILSGSGEITGSQVLFTGGKIGGWDITSTRIASPGNTLRFTSTNPKITIGTHTVGNGPGIQLGYDSGDTLTFFAGQSGTDYIKFTAGTGVDIKTAVFKLDTDHLDIDSGTNDGKIALGATPPTAYNSGNGIYMDGTAKFLFGSASADHIQYDGTNFDVQVGSLELDASNIEISSTKASMSLGEGKILLDGANSKVTIGSTSTKQITLQGHADYGYIATGKTSATSTTAGFWLANNETDPEFHVGNSTDFIKFDGGELDIQSQKLEISASTLQVSTTQASMSLGHSTTYPQGRIIIEGAGTPTFRAGTDAAWISMTTGSGIYMDGDGNFKFGDNEGQVKFYNGSFSITGSDAQIQVTDINIRADGFQLSSNEASMSLGTNFQWKAYGGSVNPYLSIGQAGSGSYGASGLFLGYNNTLTRPRVSFVGSTGYFKFDQDAYIKTQNLEVAANNIQLSSTQASMSLGGVPGAAANILLDGGNSKIEVGSANKVTIQGGAADNYIVMGNKSSFTHEGSGTAGILIGMDSSNPQAEFVKSSTNYFIFDGSSGVDIKTTNFNLDANTGDLQISSTHKSMSLGDGKVKLQGASSPYMVLNSGSNAITLKTDGTDAYMVMGSKTNFDQYDKSTAGIILGMDTGVPKIEMVKSGDDYLRYDTTDGLDLRTTKMEVSASNIQISSTQASMSIGDPASTGGAIVLHADGTDKMLKFGGKTTFDQTGTAGLIMGMDGTQPEFDYTVGTSNDQYIRMLPGGIDIKTPTFKLDTDRLDIDSATSRIDVYDASDGLRVRIGEVDPTAASRYGMVIYDGSGTAESNELVHFSDARNKIASWTISNDQIASNNLIIHSSGKLETADFASNIKGWRISSEGNGTAEFENVRIRGTLATTVFEKESVNAVGGQLLISNSTQITGSTETSPSESAIHVENVSGFQIGEILKAKKVSATGFQTEYLYVTGSKRTNDSSDTDLSGFIHVTRGYSGSLHESSSFLAGLASNSQSYEPGQVLVSTGVTGSGFILLNANPGDTSTPYIDIIERTGSNIYDIEHKVRLGDLSGLSSGLLYGNANPGFGLFTENIFLKGSITAMTGSIEGILHVRTDASNQILIGTNVSGTKDGFYINNNNYWYTNAEWRLGDTNNYLFLTGSGGSLGNDLRIQLEKFELNANGGDLQISSTHKSMSFGDGDIIFQSYDATNAWGRIGATSTKAIYITGSSTVGAIRSGKKSVGDTTAGFWLANNAGQPEFHIGDSTDYIKYYDSSGDRIEIQTRAFEMDANDGDLVLSSTHKSMSLGDSRIKLVGTSSPYIQVGNSPDYSIKIATDGTDQYMAMGGKMNSGSGFAAEGAATGGILIGMDAGNPQAEFVSDDLQTYFIFDGNSGVDVKTTAFELAANDTDLQISSTHKSMSLNNGNVRLLGSGNVGYAQFGSAPALSDNLIISASATQQVLKAGISESYAGAVANNEQGFILERALTTTKFMVGNSTDYIRFDGSNISISGDAFDVTASNVNIVAGDGMEVDAPHFELSTTNVSMSLGYDTSANYGINLYGGASANYIKLGSKTSPPLQLFSGNPGDGSVDNYLSIGGKSWGGTDTGVIIGSDAGVYKLEMYKNASTYLKFATDDSGLDVRANKIKLATPGMLLIGTETSAGSNKLTLGGTSGSISTTAGEGVYMDGSGNFRVGTATTAAAPSYMSFGSSALTVRTQDLIIDTSKIDITTEHNGMIALGASSASLADLSGNGIFFSGSGEFNLQKDTSNYLRLDGTSFDIRSQNFDLLTSTQHISSSNGGVIAMGKTIPKDLDDGGIFLSGSGEFNLQSGANDFVRSVTSTGFEISATNFRLSGSNTLAINTSKIRLGPNATSTMAWGDTGIYLDNAGDFSFVQDGSNYIKGGNSNFDIASQNFRLSGSTTLAIDTSKIRLGTNATSALVHGSTGIYFDNSGKFSFVEDSSNFIKGGNSNFEIQADTFGLGTATMVISSSANSGTIRLGTNGGPLTATTDTVGIYMDGGGAFNVYGNSTNLLRIDGGNMTLKSSAFDLVGGSTLGINTSRIFLGTITSDSDDNGAGVYMDTGGAFRLFGNSTNYITVDAGSMALGSDTFTLETSTMKLNSAVSNGKIALGATPPSHASSSTGFYADGEGTFMIGNSSGNRMQYLADGTIYMKSSTFNLDATTLILDSAANDGKIQLGPSGGPGSPTGTSNAGVYMDGQGRFNFVGDADNYIRFNATGLEINTDYFDVNTAGEITATQGAIGGWYITSTAIQTTAPGAPKAAADMTLSTAGYIAMGSTAPQTFGAGGIQMGTYGTSYGKFLVANSADTAGHIKFDAATGDLHISSSTVLLGSSGSAPHIGSFVSMSAEGQMEISSSGFHFKPGGDAVFSGGNITFEKDGDIVSNDYLIERSRLFGAGSDGPMVGGTVDTLTTGTNQTDKYSALDGLILIESHASTANLWTLQRDIYVQDLIINSNVTLETGGYRLFVRGTLTNNGTIQNNGTAGSAGSGNTQGGGGAGGNGGTLQP